MRHTASVYSILFLVGLCLSSTGFGATALSKDFLEKSPAGKDYVEWNEESGPTVTFGKGKPAIVTLKGKLAEGKTMDFDFRPIQLDTERKFEIPLELSSEPREMQLNFRDAAGQTAFVVFTYKWKKTPPILNINIREKGAGKQKSGSYDGAYPTEEWLEFIWKDSRIPEPAPTYSTGKWYNHFQLGGVAALPTTGGNSVSGQAGWNPTWRLGEKFTFAFSATGSLFKYDATTRFVVVEVGALIGWVLGPIILEVGPGAQMWVGQGGTRPTAMGFIDLPLSKKWFGFIDKLYGGYSLFFLPNSKVHEAKLGIGMSF